MQQHPVPQNIASYEFRLVGDMTLKQFLQVAGGGLVALLFYAAPLPVIIKWPLIFISSASGAALAFLPVEERPLSAWFLAFLRAIYSPTKYAYEPNRARDIFAPETQPVSAADVGVTPEGVGAAEAYLSHAALGDDQEIRELEKQEQTFFQKALSLFHLTKGAPATSTPPAVAAPAPRPQMVVEQLQPALIPQFAPIFPPPQPPPKTDQPLAGERRGPGRPRLTTPRFEISASPPSAPRMPNIIVGQVLDSTGGTVEAAILEIKDSEGRPVRALRTNKVGHFLTATSLESGSYEIITEKEGLTFDTIQMIATGEIIQPIEIRARSTGQ